MSEQSKVEQWMRDAIEEAAEDIMPTLGWLRNLDSGPTATKFRDVKMLIERALLKHLPVAAHAPTPALPPEDSSETKQNRGMDSPVDDRSLSQSRNKSGPTLAHSELSGIYAKDAAKWLRDKWPHRPMTTGGLPNESLQQKFQPTRKDIERWLVEYAEQAEPIKRATSPPQVPPSSAEGSTRVVRAPDAAPKSVEYSAEVAPTPAPPNVKFPDESVIPEASAPPPDESAPLAKLRELILDHEAEEDAEGNIVIRFNCLEWMEIANALPSPPLSAGEADLSRCSIHGDLRPCADCERERHERWKLHDIEETERGL